MFNSSQDAVNRRYEPVVIKTPMLCKCINRFRGRVAVPGNKPTDFSVRRVSKSINRMRTPHVVNELKKITCDSPIFMNNNFANVIRFGIFGKGESTGYQWKYIFRNIPWIWTELKLPNLTSYNHSDTILVICKQLKPFTLKNNFKGQHSLFYSSRLSPCRAITFFVFNPITSVSPISNTASIWINNTKWTTMLSQLSNIYRLNPV
jgi:hypothetical protein